MKKGFIAMLALTVFLALGLGFSDTADAKRGGGFKSNKQSFTQKKDSTTQQSNTGATSGTANKSGAAGSTATTKSGGLFGGNSFLKGLAVGGLAGMLFGGMIGSMGAFGEIFGFLINLLVIFAIFMVIRAAWTYVRNNKKPATAGHSNYDRDRFDRNRDEEDRNGRGQF